MSCPSVCNPVLLFPTCSHGTYRWCIRQTRTAITRTALIFELGSLDGSVPNLEGTAFCPNTMEEKINEIYLQLPFFLQNASRIENCVQTLSHTGATCIDKITSVEQIVSCFATRVVALETSAASASSGSGSARSWNSLGQSDGSTATGPHGPGSFDVNRNRRRRLDTLETGQRPTVPPFNRPPNPPGLYLKQEPSVKTLWHDTRMMVFHLKLIVPFATLAPHSWCVNPSRQRPEKLGDTLHHFGQFWFRSCKKYSLTEMLMELSYCALS